MGGLPTPSVLAADKSFYSANTATSIFNELVKVTLIDDNTIAVGAADDADVASADNIALVSLDASSLSYIRGTVSKHLLRFLHTALNRSFIQNQIGRRSRQALLHRTMRIINRIVRIHHDRFRATRGMIMGRRHQRHSHSPRANHSRYYTSQPNSHFRTHQANHTSTFRHFRSSPRHTRRAGRQQNTTSTHSRHRPNFRQAPFTSGLLARNALRPVLIVSHLTRVLHLQHFASLGHHMANLNGPYNNTKLNFTRFNNNVRAQDHPRLLIGLTVLDFRATRLRTFRRHRAPDNGKGGRRRPSRHTFSKFG